MTTPVSYVFLLNIFADLVSAPRSFCDISCWSGHVPEKIATVWVLEEGLTADVACIHCYHVLRYNPAYAARRFEAAVLQYINLPS